MLTITFDEPLPAQVPTKLPVYAVSPVGNPTREIEAIARAWPALERASAKRLRAMSNWIFTDYGQLRLGFQQVSGAVEATIRRTPEWPREGYVRFPIDDETAVKIARTFLGTGWLVEDDASKLVLGKVTHLRRQAASDEGLGPIEVLDAGVVLTRMMDDMPVVGPGGQVMVTILGNKAISGASRVFRRRGAKVDIVRIKSADAARVEFEQRLRSERHLDCPVRVLRARFGYFEAARHQRQRFFEPAYTFLYVTEREEPLKSLEVVQASGSNRGRLAGVTEL